MVKTYATGVQLQSDEPIAYEQQDGIKQTFSEAHRDYVNLELEEDYAGQTGRGSEMVREDSITHDLRPDPEIAAEQDQKTFDEKWESERVNADLEADYASQEQRDSSIERERSSDQGLSL